MDIKEGTKEGKKGDKGRTEDGGMKEGRKEVEGKKEDECKQEYAKFLSDSERFSKALDGVVSEWKHSCEHYLTNTAMNRIAWLGQAAMCYATGIPSKYCSGFNLLTDKEKEAANGVALISLNEWLRKTNQDEVSMEEGLNLGKQVEIY